MKDKNKKYVRYQDRFMSYKIVQEFLLDCENYHLVCDGRMDWPKATLVWSGP